MHETSHNKYPAYNPILTPDSIEMKNQCLELWTIVDNSLPDKGTNSRFVEGNWSCWVNGQHITGGKGMDCWPVVDYVTKVVSPKNILEIGFNAGHSTCMWLCRTKANITSVDIKYNDTVRIASEIIKKKYPERFKFIQYDSRRVYELIKDQYYDLIIIDGGHSMDVCSSDLHLAFKLKAKYILVDDVIRMSSVKNSVDEFVRDNKDIMTLIHQWSVAWGIAFYEITQS